MLAMRARIGRGRDIPYYYYCAHAHILDGAASISEHKNLKTQVKDFVLHYIIFTEKSMQNTMRGGSDLEWNSTVLSTVWNADTSLALHVHVVWLL